jgi:putative membrane protein
MRWLYLAVIILFAAAAIIFAVENLETVTVSFLSFSISMRLATLVFVIYVLGALSGGSLFALLRQSYLGSRRKGASAPPSSARQ